MEAKFKDRFANLLEIKETQTAKIGRGQDFEALINDVFEEEGLLLKRSYHTSDNRSEQIDGAIEVLNRIILFEVKWVESGLAASDLYAFIGKVDNKLIGTLGLFISKESLSDNFVNSLSKGRRRNVLLLHGNDIDLLFSENLSLKEYLTHCIRRYSFDNILHYDALSFLKNKNNADTLSKQDPKDLLNDTENVQAVLKMLLKDDKVEEFAIDLELQKLKPNERSHLASYLLYKYPKFYDAYISSILSSKARKLFHNFRYALSELVKQKEVVSNTVEKYYELYCASKNEQYLDEFLWETYKNGYELLQDKIRFQLAIYTNFKKILGNYDKENMLTKVLEDIWAMLDKDIQSKFVIEYIEIYFSDRRDGFDQKRFARKLLLGKNDDYHSVINQWIESKVKGEIESADLTVEDIPKQVKYFTRRYNDLVTVLDIDENVLSRKITRLYRKHITSQ
jgi:hypothetical protein